MIKQLKDALIAAGWVVTSDESNYISAYCGFNKSLKVIDNSRYSLVSAYDGSKQVLCLDGDDINLAKVLEYIKLT